jgi:hypothetical protein
VELVELKLVLFPDCLAERQFDRTLNQPNKVWHDRRPFTVFLIALTTTFLSCSHCLGSVPHNRVRPDPTPSLQQCDWVSLVSFQSGT